MKQNYSLNDKLINDSLSFFVIMMNAFQPSGGARLLNMIHQRLFDDVLFWRTFYGAESPPKVTLGLYPNQFLLIYKGIIPTNIHQDILKKRDF